MLLTEFTGSIPIDGMIQNILNASFQKTDIVLQIVVVGVGICLDINDGTTLI